jgi:tetratricopeptide (TPR) repeat protein
MKSTNELRVFISSTFRDLQEEREHLIKKIFPEIRSLCRERGITFTEVDLRWGITEEEAERDGIIRICLEEIDRCRPYFIGILGERYGWMPSSDETNHVGDEFPSIVASIAAGASITEMEIIHGVLANPAMAGHAFFYFRDRTATPSKFVDTDEDAIARLQELKDRIRRSGFPVRESFLTPVELGEWLQSDLWRLLDNEYPASEAPSVLEIERRSHTAFASSRRRAYIPNPQPLKEFTAWLAEGTTPLVVSAESGLGKSALAAYLTETFRAQHPSAVIIEHYVGASEQSGSALSLARHLIEEVRQRFSISEEPPIDPKKLLSECGNWLWRLGNPAAGQGQPVLVVLDALNQLDEEGRRLAWLPPVVPENLKLLVTATPGDVHEILRARGWQQLVLEPINEERVRQSIVLRYLGEFHKAIAPEQLRRITSDQKASSPLYLRVVAEELRLHGEHETLAEVIGHYVAGHDLDELFQQVLERMERDYGAGSVSEVLGLIWASRSGLSEAELLELTATSRLDLSRLLFALDYHLLHKDGLLGFFHDYLRRATAKRYLVEERARRDQLAALARYFEAQPVTLRSTLELLHALELQGERKRLEEVLAEVDRFELLWQGEARFEVLRLWSTAERERISAAVCGGLAEWQQQQQQPDTDRLDEVLAKLSELLKETGCWNDAVRLCGERVAIARSTGQRQREGDALAVLSQLENLQGGYAEAEEHAHEAEVIARELGDHRNIASAVGSRGDVHLHRGEYTEALACYAEQESIARELGDHPAIAYAVAYRGRVHRERGEYSEALACYAEAESIARELGDRKGITIAVGNRGILYNARREHAEALACYAEQEAIARELGDRQSIASAVGHRGIVHIHRGEYSEALACYAEQEAIARELGDRKSIANAVGSRGNVYVYRGEHAEALACYAERESIMRELGDRNGIATVLFNRGFVHQFQGEYSEALACYAEAADVFRNMGRPYELSNCLQGTAQVLLDRVELSEGMPEYLPEYVLGATIGTWRAMSLRLARQRAAECVAISEEISKPDTLFGGRILLAQITATEGNAEAAEAMLQKMLEEANDDIQRAELHYCFWTLASDHSSGLARPVVSKASQRESHRGEALRLCRELLKKTPIPVYHKRIEELEAAGKGS